MKTTLWSLWLIFIFLLLSLGSFVSAATECEPLWIDEFTNQNSRWQWGYSSGTGYHTIKTVEGLSVVEIGITDQSQANQYSDCALAEKSYTHSSGVMEARMKVVYNGGDNQYFGKGTMGMGFWHFTDYNSPIDAAWFFGGSPENVYPFKDFQAQVGINSAPLYLKQLPDVNLKEWHVYRVEFNNQGSKFYIDAVKVGETTSNPPTKQKITIWVDNQAVTNLNPNTGQTTRQYYALSQDQKILIDWVRYYDEPCDGVPSCGEGQIASSCDCGGTVYSSGYCCEGQWQQTSCSSSPYTIIPPEILRIEIN